MSERRGGQRLGIAPVTVRAVPRTCWGGVGEPDPKGEPSMTELFDRALARRARERLTKQGVTVTAQALDTEKWNILREFVDKQLPPEAS